MRIEDWNFFEQGFSYTAQNIVFFFYFFGRQEWHKASVAECFLVCALYFDLGTSRSISLEVCPFSPVDSFPLSYESAV